MATPVAEAASTAAATRLYFGSAVLPARDRPGEPARLGAGYRVLLGFHRLYSHSLLAATRARLNATRAD